MESQTDQLYDRIIRPIDSGWRIERTQFRAAPQALQRRVARRLLQAVLPQQPRFEHIEKLVSLAHAPNRAQTDPFPGGLVARVEHGWLTLQMQDTPL